MLYLLNILIFFYSKTNEYKLYLVFINQKLPIFRNLIHMEEHMYIFKLHSVSNVTAKIFKNNDKITRIINAINISMI